MYIGHKFIRSSVTWTYPSVDNRIWKRTSQKRVECFSKTCSQEQLNLIIALENVLKISLQEFLKTFFKRSWRCFEDVLKTLAGRLEDVLKTSWKRLEDVFKMYGQDEYIGPDQDVFWWRKAKANIFVLIKTPWRCLQDVFWRWRRKTSSRRPAKTSSSRRMFAV